MYPILWKSAYQTLKKYRHHKMYSNLPCLFFHYLFIPFKDYYIELNRQNMQQTSSCSMFACSGFRQWGHSKIYLHKMKRIVFFSVWLLEVQTSDIHGVDGRWKKSSGIYLNNLPYGSKSLAWHRNNFLKTTTYSWEKDLQMYFVF